MWEKKKRIYDIMRIPNNFSPKYREKHNDTIIFWKAQGHRHGIGDIGWCTSRMAHYGSQVFCFKFLFLKYWLASNLTPFYFGINLYPKKKKNLSILLSRG